MDHHRAFRGGHEADVGHRLAATGTGGGGGDRQRLGGDQQHVHQGQGGAPGRSLVGRCHKTYNLVMIRAYEEIVEFIAAGTTPRTVARFEPSQETKDRVAELIHREKTSGLEPDEASELDQYLRMEHMMRLAKARARSYFADE